MPIVTEESRTSRPIVTNREPVAPKNSGSKGSVGDQALMDTILIVIIAWVVLILLSFSLRKHNV